MGIILVMLFIINASGDESYWKVTPQFQANEQRKR